jgi:hypothetical protein
MDTLLLDVGLWDLCLDANGNIALASVPYARAQDVASAIRLFLGELWYDSTKGIDYFGQILGDTPPLTLFQEFMVTAALTVPGVVTASCVVESFDDAARTVTGQVTFTDVDGNTSTVSI